MLQDVSTGVLESYMDDHKTPEVWASRSWEFFVCQDVPEDDDGKLHDKEHRKK